MIAVMVLMLMACGCSHSGRVLSMNVAGVGLLGNGSMAEAEQAAHKQAWVNAREKLDLMGLHDFVLVEGATISGRTVRGGYEVTKRFSAYPPQVFYGN